MSDLQRRSGQKQGSGLERERWCLFQNSKAFQEILIYPVLAELKLYYNRNWEIQLFQLGLLLLQTKLGFVSREGGWLSRQPGVTAITHLSQAPDRVGSASVSLLYGWSTPPWTLEL